jgi:hypothetical protein
MSDFSNLSPGTKFTIFDSDVLYTLVGYTKENNIVYFDGSKLDCIDKNMIVSPNSVINTVVSTDTHINLTKTFRY